MKKKKAHEQGTIYKEWKRKVRICLVYPNTYWIGMSNLGFQTIYRLLNERNDTVCERAFLPERFHNGEPLLSYESKRGLWEFDIIAFSLPFELDYFNIPTIFELGRIPPFSYQRKAPFVIAGGIAPSLNPLSIQGFFDAILIGEAEGAIDEFVEIYKEERKKEKVLDALMKHPNFYIPNAKGAKRRWIEKVPVNFSSIITPYTEFGSQLLIELCRGCGRGCRFCAAGFFYRPQRNVSLHDILEKIKEEGRRFKRIGFIGTSVCDYPHLLSLCEKIKEMNKEFVIPSVHPETLSEDFSALITQKTLTIALETTSTSLQKRINKQFSKTHLIEALKRLHKKVNVKFYFMIGLPGQKREDIKECIEFLKEAEKIIKCSVNIACFVPKPHTPFQWERMKEEKELSKMIKEFKKSLPHLKIKSHSPKEAILQYILSWGKDLDRFLYLLQKKEVSIEHLLKGEHERIDPSQYIESGLKKEYLKKEWRKESLTPPCSKRCNGCGVCL